MLTVLKGISVAIGLIYYVFPALMGIELRSTQRNNEAFQGVICCRLSLLWLGASDAVAKKAKRSDRNGTETE